jgi:hypothetical protein
MPTNETTEKKYAIACYIALHEQLIIYSVGRLDFGLVFYNNKE